MQGNQGANLGGKAVQLNWPVRHFEMFSMKGEPAVSKPARSWCLLRLADKIIIWSLAEGCRTLRCDTWNLRVMIGASVGSTSFFASTSFGGLPLAATQGWWSAKGIHLQSGSNLPVGLLCQDELRL